MEDDNEGTFTEVEYASAMKRRYECEYGGQYTQDHKQTHFKTMKHLAFINHWPLGSVKLVNESSVALKRRAKHECECGGRYNTNGKAPHLKTKKHLDFINHDNAKLVETTKGGVFKHECECGARYTTKGKAPHFRTRKHLAFINRFKPVVSLKPVGFVTSGMKRKDRHECECGGHYTIYLKEQHCRSKKHRRFAYCQPVNEN